MEPVERPVEELLRARPRTVPRRARPTSPPRRRRAAPAGGSAGSDRGRPSRLTSHRYELEREGPLADLAPPARGIGRTELLLAAERAVERDRAGRRRAHRSAPGVANAVSWSSSRARTNSVNVGASGRAAPCTDEPAPRRSRPRPPRTRTPLTFRPNAAASRRAERAAEVHEERVGLVRPDAGARTSADVGHLEPGAGVGQPFTWIRISSSKPAGAGRAPRRASGPALSSRRSPACRTRSRCRPSRPCGRARHRGQVEGLQLPGELRARSGATSRIASFCRVVVRMTLEPARSGRRRGAADGQWDRPRRNPTRAGSSPTVGSRRGRDARIGAGAARARPGAASRNSFSSTRRNSSAPQSFTRNFRRAWFRERRYPYSRNNVVTAARPRRRAPAPNAPSRCAPSGSSTSRRRPTGRTRPTPG